MNVKSTDQILKVPVMLNDHPVLEFVNTRPMVDGRLQDQLLSDADVLSTLKRFGMNTRYEGTGLLAAALELREELRHLLDRRKVQTSLNLAGLNEFLRQAKSHVKLCKGRDGSLTLDRVWECSTPVQVLAPLAEAAADLLVSGDFSLIRRCEGDLCVLWFYDRTKSHHRRWCSMNSCGNRNKVASFRQRQEEASSRVRVRKK